MTLISPDEITNVLESWDLEPHYESIRSSWHNVLRVHKGAENFYLRITPNIRHPNEILAELEWMQDLNSQGIPVVKVIEDRSGEILQSRNLKSGLVSICCFQEAFGRPTQKDMDFREPVIENWAKLLLKLHSHAKSYTAKSTQARRSTWDKDAILQIALREAESSTESEAAAFIKIIKHFQSLGQGSSLILTHGDLHFGNMTLNEKTDDLCAFDFDDACYHFPEHDVAVALVSIRKAAWEQQGSFNAQKLETLFLQTYANPTLDLDLWYAYRIGCSYFWALGSARLGAFDEDRLQWLKRSTPWWKAQLKKSIG